VRQYREAVGDEMDLCLEIHRRLTPPEAIALAREIERYRPFFYEDPIRPENVDTMAQVAQKIGIPVATGERFFSLHEFQLLLARNGAQFLRPSPCVVGGITATKKIAALAQAHQKSIVPHNPGIVSPVATAACVQLGAAIPNLAIQEYPGGEDRPPISEIVRTEVRIEQGFIVVPDAPGLGVELVPGCQERHPPVRREVRTRVHVDGSVVDQ
jgi:galactonate dehydratase